MAAMVCPVCDVSYPYPYAGVCRWCGGRLDYDREEMADPDWTRDPDLAAARVLERFEHTLARHAEFDAWLSEHKED